MSSPLFSFAVLSDLHFMAYKEPERPVDWVPFLREEISHLNAMQPSFIVVNGDLTNGKERDYRLAMTAFAQCSMPVYYTMGNHEYYGCYEEENFTSEKAHHRFLDWTSMPWIYFEKRIGGISMLFLSTEHYAPDSNEAAWLSKRQLDWLEERLSTANGCTSLVFLHHPVNGTVAASENTCRESTPILEIFERYPNVILFSGHTHCRMDREDQIVRRKDAVFVGGGCLYEDFPQSRWVDVYPDHIILRIYCHLEHKWLDTFKTSLPIRR
ncbi:3',5'-cyclic AMP phosphodiesterase CpdA [Paenibacillus taihuensis]|uniref:3',5'-cyclic AMP phosphodiesterase CpdA n=1 Tax=Paenibacillus taihuensis TaxID=1156355 RepID=A0A3D9R0L4_9BACL|nr:metallophosphoesterase [Paenibacillus taihuensis]REE67319.1 3',5'-cyclic AMP phosphodiesterase CpdA [Paenibacillus taihuensis]